METEKSQTRCCGLRDLRYCSHVPECIVIRNPIDQSYSRSWHGIFYFGTKMLVFCSKSEYSALQLVPLLLRMGPLSDENCHLSLLVTKARYLMSLIYWDLDTLNNSPTKNHVHNDSVNITKSYDVDFDIRDPAVFSAIVPSLAWRMPCHVIAFVTHVTTQRLAYVEGWHL